MNKELITITMKWRLKKNISYLTFPVEIQKESEKALCVKSLDTGKDFYAGWIPKKVIMSRKTLNA